MTKTNHKELVIVSEIEEGFELVIFTPKENSWSNLIAFDIESLDLQASFIYNVDILEVLN
jgi:hypothetical protein